MRYVKLIFLSMLLGITCLNCQAKKGNVDGAKELFMKVYNSAFGPQGSTLSYKVNLVGLFKAQGTIVFKGNKSHFSEKRYMSWDDGVTVYRVDNKKREVNIYSHSDEKKDKYMSKFKFNPGEFDYTYITKGDFHFITAKVRNSGFFGIKHVTLKVRTVNLEPVSMTIKMGLIRTTVQITDFHSGNISDNAFIFPREQFRGYKFTDNR